MPDLDSCLSNIYADVNFAADPGAITVPEYSGYLLTAEGDRIIVQTTTHPKVGPYYFETAVSPTYAIGLLLLS